MRWEERVSKKSRPRDRERRVIKRFLFLPKTLNGITKWLEFVKINQIYYEGSIEATGGYDLFGSKAFYITSSKWYDDYWVE